MLPLRDPRPLGFGGPGWSYPLPWSMQTWLDGVVATPTGLETSETFAGDIATLLESLRGADTRGRAFDGEGRGGVVGGQDAWMETCFANSGELLDVPVLRSIWHRATDLPHARVLAMSHKDLTPPNILVHGENIVGILDAGGSDRRTRRSISSAPGTFSTRTDATSCAPPLRPIRGVAPWCGVGVRAGDGICLVLPPHRSLDERPWQDHARATPRRRGAYPLRGSFRTLDTTEPTGEVACSPPCWRQCMIAAECR